VDIAELRARLFRELAHVIPLTNYCFNFVLREIIEALFDTA